MEVVVEPGIVSHLHGFEAVLCLVSILFLLKCLKEILSNRDGVCCIQWNQCNWNTRMQYLQQRDMWSAGSTAAMIRSNDQKHISIYWCWQGVWPIECSNYRILFLFLLFCFLVSLLFFHYSLISIFTTKRWWLHISYFC